MARHVRPGRKRHIVEPGAVSNVYLGLGIRRLLLSWSVAPCIMQVGACAGSVAVLEKFAKPDSRVHSF